MRPLVIAIFLVIVSDGAINGLPWREEQSSGSPPLQPYRRFIPEVLRYIGARAFAHLTEQSVSTKPPNWFLKPEEELTRIVQGALVNGENFRHASARGSFQFKVKLREGQLQRPARLHTLTLTNSADGINC